NVALQLPLASQVAGIYDQYAQARSNGTSAGAAGAVTDNGAIMVGESNPDPGLPGTGTLHLAGLAPTVTPLADLRLELGALAASAVLDACPTPATVTRDYGIASLHLMQDGPAIDSLRS